MNTTRDYIAYLDGILLMTNTLATNPRGVIRYTRNFYPRDGIIILSYLVITIQLKPLQK